MNTDMFANTETRPSETRDERLATPAQLRYLRILFQDREIPMRVMIRVKINERMRFTFASYSITKAKECPKRNVYVPGTTTPTELQDGIYFLDGAVYKVKHAAGGSGHQYASILNPNDLTPTGKARFNYSPGTIKFLRPEHRMTKELAVEYSALYGVCVNCGATLSNETSIERGMGPVCYGRMA